ncbi:MAG: AMP-binding protein [Gammaproteobacteria bacterium]|nr:AMP-binding protein [Gammaproteobacteria bacterium]
MTRLTDIDDFATAQQACTSAALWALFDGDREFMNLAHECLDRHRARGTAVSVKSADGGLEHLAFGALADDASRFAHWLAARGVGPGERVAVMLEPGRAFYACMFGAIKAGAIAVPLFTLFGPDGLALRLDDCKPRVLIADAEGARLGATRRDLLVVTPNAAFWDELAALPAAQTPRTRADSLAVFQYTSGTTRELPEAVRHTQRSVVTLMVAALYGVGLRPGDRYFCPSSPAWGHGLWHGTIAPLALGVHVGAYAGKFDPARLYDALIELDIDNFAAAATVYRMLRNSGVTEGRPHSLRKCSFTGEPLDPDTFDWIERTFGVAPASMYGTTEVGVIMLDYPGMRGHRVKRGALGKPAPGNEVAILDESGQPLGDDVIGEIAVKRRGEWFRVKDFGRRDADGYYYHAGRADDVIISAGWTMSAVEIENVLLTHPAVAEAAVIGVPDPLRGQIAKACIVARAGHQLDVPALQDYMKDRLAKHEYPRAVELVSELPKTPAGKINRKVLRDQARAAAAQDQTGAS